MANEYEVWLNHSWLNSHIGYNIPLLWGTPVNDYNIIVKDHGTKYKFMDDILIKLLVYYRIPGGTTSRLGDPDFSNFK